MSNTVVGITGSDGFIGGHIARRLQNEADFCVLPCPRGAFEDEDALAQFVNQCDTVIHLAGVNRGTDQEVSEINRSLAEKLVAAARRCSHDLHLVYASSTQRKLDNVYGQSKKDCEQIILDWVSGSEGKIATLLVIPNVYGAGCKPFYNSVVATFCHQLAQGDCPQVLEDKTVDFVWVNDLVDQVIHLVRQRPDYSGLFSAAVTATITISDLLSKLKKFRRSHFDDDLVPDLTDRFDTSLYATFESYLNLEDHSHRPQVHMDDRGKLYEVLRIANAGQVFFSTTKPGVIRGNHFHTRKIEWFCVLQGEAVIRLRHVESSEVREFRVSGSSPQFISIPVLYTHQIENVGKEDLLTMFWCNEVFKPEDADTYFEKVA